MRGGVSVALENSASDLVVFRAFGMMSPVYQPSAKPRVLTIRSSFTLLAPCLINVPLSLWHVPGRATGMAWAWLVYFAGCSLVLLIGMGKGWPRLVDAGPVVDDLIPDASEQQEMARLICRYLRAPPQVLAMTGGAFMGVSSLLLAQQSLSSKLAIGVSSYLTVAITGSLAGVAAFWVVALVHLAHRTQTSLSLHVRWLDPARTPGILALAAGYTFGAPFGGMAFALGEVPVLYSHSLAPESVGVIVANMAAPVIALVILVSWSVLPHYWFSKLIVSKKREALLGINDWIVYRGARAAWTSGQGPEPAWPADNTLRKVFRGVSADVLLGAYGTVSDAPETTFPSGAYVQYSAAFGALLLPYLFRVGVRMMGIS
jgi:hypothetical protein